MNPTDLYSDILVMDELQNFRARGILGTEILSSINSGVLMGNNSTFFNLAKRSIKFAEDPRIKNIIKDNWKLEQFSVSIAAGEVGVYQLDTRWNATPLSDIPENQVQLWHYNDSDAITRSIKRNLLEPKLVEKYLKKLSKNWPLLANKFRNYYIQAIEKIEIARFI